MVESLGAGVSPWGWVVAVVVLLLAAPPLLAFAISRYPRWWVEVLCRVRLAVLVGQTSQRRLPSDPPGEVVARAMDAAAERVKPGGRLVYCTCSLEREEGETQIIAFLRRNPAFRTVSADPAALGAPLEALTPEGWLRILPSMWAEKGGLDGFFAARLERVS